MDDLLLEYGYYGWTLWHNSEYPNSEFRRSEWPIEITSDVRLRELRLTKAQAGWLILFLTLLTLLHKGDSDSLKAIGLG